MVRLPEEAFGAQAWKDHFGVDVDLEPNLPYNIESILNSNCPFWTGRRIRDTHLLTLMPGSINGGIPVTARFLGELAVRLGHDVGLEQCLADTPYLTTPFQGTYWVLMTRQCIPESQNMLYPQQIDLVCSLAQSKGVSYALPRFLEAWTSVMTHVARSGEKLYSTHTSSSTLCQEVQTWSSADSYGGLSWPSGDYPLVVGHMRKVGVPDLTQTCLRVSTTARPSSTSKSPFQGVAACLKL